MKQWRGGDEGGPTFVLIHAAGIVDEVVGHQDVVSLWRRPGVLFQRRLQQQRNGRLSRHLKFLFHTTRHDSHQDVFNIAMIRGRKVTVRISWRTSSSMSSSRASVILTGVYLRYSGRFT